MVMYYDPEYEPWEYEFSNDMECNECREWQLVEGIGMVQHTGEVLYDWKCDNCGYINTDSTVANVSNE